jgi:competence protein ComEA
VFEFTPGQRLLLGALALVVALSGAVLVRSRGRAPAAAPPVNTATPAPPAKAADTAPGDTLLVHVAGAVRQPGLYRLPSDARVADALEKAGGARAEARLGDLNLAAHLKDGVKLTVPGASDGPPDKVIVVTEDVYVHGPPRESASADDGPNTVLAGGVERAAPRASARAKKKPPPSQPIDLNAATLEQLQQLPGIGPTMAARIVAWRATHGRLARPEDLLEVKGIGPKSFAKLQPYVTVR